MHTNSQVEVQENSQAEVQTNSQAEVQTNSQAEVHTNNQSEVQTNSRAEVHRISQAEMQTKSQTEVHANSTCNQSERGVYKYSNYWGAYKHMYVQSIYDGRCIHLSQGNYGLRWFQNSLLTNLVQITKCKGFYKNTLQ